MLDMLDVLRKQAQGASGVTVRILPAVDHDGVCATGVLVKLLKQSGVEFDVHPVACNGDIVDKLKQLAQLGSESKVRSLVMLNCGGYLNLEDLLPADLKCWVIDAHRPLQVNNLSSRNQQVIVLDDDEDGLLPEIEETDDDESEGQESGEEEWDPDKKGARPSREETRELKRKRHAEREVKRHQKRQKLLEYYQNAYRATPTAMSVYKLARQAGLGCEDMLWLAAVALTGYQVQGLISEERYSRFAWEELKDALDGTSEGFFGSTSTANSQDSTLIDSVSDAEDTGSQGVRRRPILSRGLQQQRIRFAKELRLTLYKHWTLEESIQHTAYFNGTLELSKEKGTRALNAFFAQCGIRPTDFRQMFGSTMLKTKKSLHKLFREQGKSYGLLEQRMFMEEFMRELGNVGETSSALRTNEVSCTDAVQIINALLGANPPSLCSHEKEHLPKDADGRCDMVTINELEREALVGNFYKAFDAVLCTEPKLLEEGLAAAIQVVKAVEQMGRSIRDTHALRSTRHFRWVKQDQLSDLFRHPIALRRLALWTLQVMYTYRPKTEAKELPLLLIVRDQIHDTYLFVGVTPEGRVEQDEFPKLFRSALDKDKSIRYRYDFFDRSCLEVVSQDFDRFWKLLSGAEA